MEEKTVETVPSDFRALITGLKPGVNERWDSLAQKSVQQAASLLSSLLKTLRIRRQHQQAGSLLYTFSYP